VRQQDVVAVENMNNVYVFGQKTNASGPLLSYGPESVFDADDSPAITARLIWILVAIT
jgi:hypothetical protein